MIVIAGEFRTILMNRTGIPSEPRGAREASPAIIITESCGLGSLAMHSPHLWDTKELLDIPQVWGRHASSNLIHKEITMAVGIVLSGGGSRTDFQVGALKYLTLRGLRPIVVCGTSGGAPNAAMFAAGEGTDSLEQHWKSLQTWRDSFVLSDWLQAVTTDWQVMFVAQAESLLSLGAGMAASALSAAMGLPPILFGFDLIRALVTLGLDIPAIVDLIRSLATSSFQSILSPKPFMDKLQGNTFWEPLSNSQTPQRLAVSNSLDGRLHLFMVGSDFGLYHIAQLANGQWGAWSWLSGPSVSVAEVAVTCDSNGFIHAVVLTQDGHVLHSVEVAPGSETFTAFADIGGMMPQGKRRIAGFVDTNRLMNVLLIGLDNRIHITTEISAGSGVFGAFMRIGGLNDTCQDFQVGENFDHRFEIFRIAEDQQVFHCAQAAPGGGFGAWEQLGAGSDLGIDLAVCSDAHNRLAVFRVDPGGGVFSARQLMPGFFFGGWQPVSLSSSTGIQSLVATLSPDGHIQLFAQRADGGVVEAKETTPGSRWSLWYYASDPPSGVLAAGSNPLQSRVEAFVGSSTGAMLHGFAEPPLLEQGKVAASGIKLRIAVVELESGQLYFVDEQGQLVDHQELGTVTLAEAVLASTALPMVFPPILMASEGRYFVDGGLRDLLPIKAALDAGADAIIAVVSGDPGIQLESSYAGANLFKIGYRSLTEIMPNQILEDHLHPAMPWLQLPIPPSGPAQTVPVKVVRITEDLHGEIEIDPGLTTISMDYGFMRAYDQLDPRPTPLFDHPQAALMANSDAILQLRQQIWRLEHEANGQALPLREFTDEIAKLLKVPPPSPQVDLSMLPEIRRLKWQLKGLVDYRKQILWGRVPANVAAWWSGWEAHSWTPITPTPWDTPFPPPGKEATFPPLGPDGTVLREKHGNQYYIVFGGALFPIAGGLPWNGHSAGSESIVPDGSLAYDRSLPRDGTVFREENDTQIYVTAGGAKFPIPGIPIPDWPQVTGPIHVVPHGSSSAIPDTPADWTLLNALDDTGNTTANYVIFGGAKFEIPAVVLLDEKSFLALGYPPYKFCSVFASTLSEIPTIPRDGALLKELSSDAIFMMETGTKRQIIHWESLLEQPFFLPDLGVLWDQALDAFPVGQPI